MNTPHEIQDLCQALLRGLSTVLGDKLYGVYLYGALAFPGEGATGDIDFHVILSAALSEGERSDLRELHAVLAREHPPLGAELDGYYLLLEEARGKAPPGHQLRPSVIDNSWALHRAHILAGRCIVLYGPDPGQVYPPATWPELESALQGELEYVQRHLADYPAYCVLNLCRLMLSYDTEDVVLSKRGSAAWAYDAFPPWRSLIDAARRSYDRRATARDQEILQSGVGPFFDFARERKAQSPGKRSTGAENYNLGSVP